MAHPYQTTLFVDIETVPQTQYLGIDRVADLFKKRFNYLWNGDKQWEDIYNEQVSFHAEFGKVACISIGRIVEVNDHPAKFYIRTKASKNEKEILTHFAEVLENIEKPVFKLVGHNAKDFDFPFLFRRFIVNGMSIPGVLNPLGKKPWEFPWEDTMEMWGAGQFKYKASLELICHCLGIDSPKEGMSGANVAEMYYSEGAKDVLPFDHEEAVMKAIAEYCGGDVVAMAKVYCIMKRIEFPGIVEYV